MRYAILTATILVGLMACASTPGNRVLVRETAPRVSQFQFDNSPPLSAATDFEPWAVLTADNAIDGMALEGFGAASWGSLYRVVATHQGDCKAIATAKYFTLRRLGFEPEDLRVVMNWDDREQDWHALLAVRDADRTWVLDSILGPQEPRAFSYAYMVYSISEQGVWDHAPDFVPVP